MNGDRPPAWPDRMPWALLPPLVWWGLFVALPLLVIVAISVMSRGTYGGVEQPVTLSAYAALADPLYLRIYVRSILLASATTALCLLLGFPLAWHIAGLPARRQLVWLTLVMIPLWTNFLVRTYAWMFVLRADGLLNTILLALGVIRSPLEILYTDWAVLIGLVYGYLPFMVLPLYATLERMDRSLLEAAWDPRARPDLRQLRAHPRLWADHGGHALLRYRYRGHEPRRRPALRRGRPQNPALREPQWHPKERSASRLTSPPSN